MLGLQDISRGHPGQRVIVVLHGGVLQAIYRQASLAELSDLPLSISNTSNTYTGPSVLQACCKARVQGVDEELCDQHAGCRWGEVAIRLLG